MRYLPLAMALLLAGCIDFRQITEPFPEPPPPRPELPAEFHANLVLEEGSGRRVEGVRIHALLTPGRGPDGWPHDVGDDTLRVSGLPFTPVDVSPDGTRVYEGWVPLPEPGVEGMLLSVSPPPAARKEEWPPVLWQPVPRRIGGDTLEVGAGEDLLLPFSLPEPPAGPRPLDRSWYLEVGGGQSHFSVSGTGAPPSPLVVPLDLIPPTPGVPLTARLHLNSRTGLGTREGGGPFIEVVLSASLGWTVVPRASDPAG